MMPIAKRAFAVLFFLLLTTPAAVAQQIASAPASATAPDPTARPYYLAATLTGAFRTDPLPIGVLAGGRSSVVGLAGDCVGNITPERPDATIDLEDVHGPVNFYVAAGTDTALVVHTPAGQWLCTDDSEAGGVNPVMTLTSPGNGPYAIWVASVEAPDRPVPAVLVISELPPVW
jgi:serine protease Do